MGRSWLVNAFANNMQIVVQNVLPIAAKQQHWGKNESRIENTPFAEDAGEPFVQFIDKINYKQESTDILDDEEEFFPTGPHPFCAGTIIEENGLLFRGREMDRLVFYDSLQVLDDPNKTLNIISDSDQYWTTCSGAPSIPLITWTICHYFAQLKMNTGTIGYSINQHGNTTSHDSRNDWKLYAMQHQC